MEVISGQIPLQAPIPESLTTEQQIEAFQTAHPDMPRDEIVAYVEFYQSVMQFDASKLNLDTVSAAGPSLNSPSAMLGSINAAEAAKEAKGNPFLKANPLATFFIVFLELQAELSKIKVNEAMQEAILIVSSIEVAKTLAQTVKRLKYQEMAMNIFSAIWTGVGAATNISFGIASMGKGGEFNQALAMVGQGATSLFSTMGEKISNAIINATQAELEYAKTIIENMLRIIQDRGISVHSDAKRTADEMLSQILQKLDKIIDEAIRAHTWSRG